MWKKKRECKNIKKLEVGKYQACKDIEQKKY